MSSTECKTSELGAVVLTRDITTKIPGKCEIFKKAWKCYKPQCHYGSINTRLLTTYGIKKHKEKIAFKNLVQ